MGKEWAEKNKKYRGLKDLQERMKKVEERNGKKTVEEIREEMNNMRKRLKELK